MAAQSQEELLSSQNILFTEGVWSDLTINCGKDTYKVHKAVICPRSVFFTKACSDGRFKEGDTGVLNLEEDDPVAVKAMIHYLYHLDYPHEHRKTCTLNGQGNSPTTPGNDVNGSGLTPAAASWLTSGPGLTLSTNSSTTSPTSTTPISRRLCQGCPNFTLHAKVYALAEKYGIPSLKAVALNKFKSEARYLWFACDFIKSAELVYSSTVQEDRGLRDIVVETIDKHPTIVCDDRLWGRDSLKENPDLARDALLYILRKKMADGSQPEPNKNGKRRMPSSST